MKLYKVTAENDIVCVTDDIKKAKEKIIELKNKKRNVHLQTYKPRHVSDVSEIDIFVNDDAQEYGYTFIWQTDAGYSVDLWQNRLNISEGDFNTWYEVLSECGKCYGNCENKDIYECISAHYDFWLKDTPDKLPPVFKLTENEVTVLLKSGFLSDHIFIEVDYQKKY